MEVVVRGCVHKYACVYGALATIMIFLAMKRYPIADVVIPFIRVSSPYTTSAYDVLDNDPRHHLPMLKLLGCVLSS